MPTIHVTPESTALLQEIAASLYKAKKVVVVTGAGISTNSGIPDFRSENGLYSLIQAQFEAASKEGSSSDEPRPLSPSSPVDDASQEPPKKRRRISHEEGVCLSSDQPREDGAERRTEQTKPYGKGREASPGGPFPLEEDIPETIVIDDKCITMLPSSQGAAAEGARRSLDAMDDPSKPDALSHGRPLRSTKRILGEDYDLPNEDCKEHLDREARVPVTASDNFLPRLSEHGESVHPKIEGYCSSSILSSPQTSTPKLSHLPSDSELPSYPLSSSPLSSPPPILFDPYQDASSGSTTSPTCSSPTPANGSLSHPESMKTSPTSTPLLASQSSFSSTASSLATLPNLKGRDLFDSSIWADPVKTSVFYTFTTTLRQKARDVEPTPSHEFLGVLRDCRKLVRCYTQNIDQLEERVGLATSLGLGPGSRARFSTRGRASGVGGPGGDTQRKGEPAGQAGESGVEQHKRDSESRSSAEQEKATPSQVQVTLIEDMEPTNFLETGDGTAERERACGESRRDDNGSRGDEGKSGHDDRGSREAGDTSRPVVGKREREASRSDPGPIQPTDTGCGDVSAPARTRPIPTTEDISQGLPESSANGAADPAGDSRVTTGLRRGNNPRPSSDPPTNDTGTRGRDTLQTPPPSSPRRDTNTQCGQFEQSELTDEPPPRNRVQPVKAPSVPSAPNRGVECVFLHGSLNCLRCFVCSRTSSWDEADRELDTLAGRQPTCPHCAGATAAREERGKRALGVGKLRPDIVLYGEEHPLSHLISPLVQHDLSLAPDMLLILGTSLRVHGLKVLVKEFAKAVHTKGGKVVFINYTKPPGSVWADVIDFWVQWDCDAWVTDVKGRKPALWLPPGSVIEDEESKPAKVKREGNGDERGNSGEASKPKRRKGDPLSSLPSLKKAKDATEPAERRQKKEPKLNPNAKKPVAVRDDKLNGAYMTWKIMKDLRRIAGTSRQRKSLPTSSTKLEGTPTDQNKKKKARKSAPAILDSQQVPAPPAAKDVHPSAVTSLLPDGSVSAAVKLNPRKRKPKNFEGYEVELTGSRKSGSRSARPGLTPSALTLPSVGRLLPRFPQSGAATPASVSLPSPFSFCTPTLSLPPLKIANPDAAQPTVKPRPLEPRMGSLVPQPIIPTNVGGSRWSLAERLVNPFFLADPLGSHLRTPPVWKDPRGGGRGQQDDADNWGPAEQLRKEEEAAMVLSDLRRSVAWSR